MNRVFGLDRTIAGVASATILTLLALAVTYYSPVFHSIPWIMPLLAIAVMAWMGSVRLAAAMSATLAVLIYRLILAPMGGIHRPALVQAISFLTFAALMLFLVRQRNVAVSSRGASVMHYGSVAETASDVIIAIDSNSMILSINPAVKAIFGYEPEELIGRQMVELMPPRFRDSHLAGLTRFLSTGEKHIPWTGIQLPGLRKSGEEIPLEVSFGSYRSEGRTFFTGFIRDISERRKSQEALMQSEKLAAVGRLASSIAHEINNPLEAVTNLLYLARKSGDSAQVQEYLEVAEQELGRVSMIANQTLQFHKGSSLQAAAACNGLVKESLALYQGRLANADIEVLERLRARRAIYCVEGEVRQILNNLVGNAIDALPVKDGRLHIRTRDAWDWKSGRSGVAITIADSGTGMNGETATRIFEPFFSTKGPDGVGLGLWVSSRLVQHNAGTLRVRSSEGGRWRGTVFVLFLPEGGGAGTPVVSSAVKASA
jgi:PAS domain S-box-containing protein